MSNALYLRTVTKYGAIATKCASMTRYCPLLVACFPSSCSLALAVPTWGEGWTQNFLRWGRLMLGLELVLDYLPSSVLFQ